MQSGALAVFSPTALTPEVRSTVDLLGSNVKYIAALDFEHHIFISDWSRAFPSASLLGVEGLPEKRESSSSTAGSNFKYIWTAKNKHDMTVDSEFDQEFEVEYVDGHANKELVVLFKRDKTLIEADLLFNLPSIESFARSSDNPEAGLLNKVFNRVFSTKGSAIWHKRIQWYAMAKNRPSFNASTQRIAAWDFDKIIPCHGDVIENGGKGIFQKVFEWHINANKSNLD